MTADPPKASGPRHVPIRTEYTGRKMEAEDDAAAVELLRPCFEAIGQIATAWSHVEQVIDDLIWTLAEVRHDKGACITSQLQSLFPRFRALTALVELHGGGKTLLKEIDAASNAGMSLAKERNRAVHDPIGYHINKKIVVVHKITADKSLVMDLVPIDLEEYRKIRQRITAYELRLMKLRDSIYAALPPFADR